MYRNVLMGAAALTLFPFAPSVWAADSASGIETVTVTASPLGQSPDTFATIVDSVDRDQILEQGGANLADSLKDIPGVSSTGFAAGASRPVIRGMDANRVRVLEDGLSSSDVSDIGPDHGVPIDPLATQRIEVVRGAATLRYGSQAIGGVVNAINNRIPLTLPDEPLNGEIAGSYGSNADTEQTSAMFDGAAGQFAFHVDGFRRRAGDYGIPGGTQFNSFSREDGISAGSSYFFGNGNRIGGAVVYYDATYGIPSDTTYIDMKQTKYMTDSSFNVGTGPLQTITVQGSYADYQHTENEPDGTVDSTFLNKEWDGRSEALFGAIGPFDTSAIGVQVQNRKFSALGADSSYLFPTTTQSEAGYVFTDAPIGSTLHIQGAARVEQVHITGTPASNIFTTRNYTPVSGSLGLVWDATDALKFGLTLTSAARAPAVTELFARGGHDGPGTFETGDPDLAIERSNSAEGTVRWKLGGANIEASLWDAQFKNYIFGFLTGRTCDDDGNCVNNDSRELKELNYEQADANFRGAEAKVDVPLLQSDSGTLSANLLADYVRATFSGGGNVPRIPPYRIGGGLGWTSNLFDASVLVLDAGSHDDVAFDETPTKGYVEVDAQAAVRPLDSNPGFEIALIGHNLTDATERDSVALNKDVVLLPGRDVTLLVRQAF